MSVFNFIGPLMVSPSSSHTAGALRLARIAMHLLGHIPEKAIITFPQSGSFATSYKGHGSDKAIAGGLLGYLTNDPRIKNSLVLFKEQSSMDIQFKVEEFEDVVHPNTIRFQLWWQNKNIKLEGTSVGGGNIRVTSVLGFKIDYDGKHDVITVLGNDYPGLLLNVIQKISSRQISIYRAYVSLIEHDEYSEEPRRSYINIELQSHEQEIKSVVKDLNLVKGVIGVRYIPKLKFAEELVFHD